MTRSTRVMMWMCVILGVLLGAEALYFLLFETTTSEPVSELPSASTTEVSLPRLKNISDSSYDVITAAPLFDPMRKPVTSTASKENSLVVGEWRLTGVVKAENKNRVMFQALDGSRLVTLDEGMFLDGWRITRVSDDRVTLDSKDDSLDMVLPVSLSSDNDATPGGGSPSKKNAVSPRKSASAASRKKAPAKAEAETDLPNKATVKGEQPDAKNGMN